LHKPPNSRKSGGALSASPPYFEKQRLHLDLDQRRALALPCRTSGFLRLRYAVGYRAACPTANVAAAAPASARLNEAAEVGEQIFGVFLALDAGCNSAVEEVVSAMRRTWAMVAALALVAAVGAAPAAPAAAQEERRSAADVPSRKVIRTKRLRVPADLFERDAV